MKKYDKIIVTTNINNGINLLLRFGFFCGGLTGSGDSTGEQADPRFFPRLGAALTFVLTLTLVASV